jgi:hypothetical protein
MCSFYFKAVAFIDCIAIMELSFDDIPRIVDKEVGDKNVFSAPSTQKDRRVVENQRLETLRVIIHRFWEPRRFGILSRNRKRQTISLVSNHLLKLKGLIKEHDEKEDKPENKIALSDALIILTGEPLAYKDGNGVFIIPIGSLR